MLMRFRRLLFPLALLALAGCNSVGTSLDGRSVTGRSAWFSYAGLRSNGHQASITLGGKTVMVTPAQVTWHGGGSLDLPTSWKLMELDEVADSLLVVVDGRQLARIRPAA